MIKFVVAALWLCAVTAGSIFYSLSSTGQVAANTSAEQPYFGGLDYIKADLISVPNIRKARIDGYFLARLVYTVEPEKLKKLSETTVAPTAPFSKLLERADRMSHTTRVPPSAKSIGRPR